jgi:hypothetical protein
LGAAERGAHVPDRRDVRQVDRDRTDGHGGADLVAAERRIAEVDVECRRQHLSLQHRVHRRSRLRSPRPDDAADVRGERTGRAEERLEPAQIRQQRRLIRPADDRLAVLVLPEADRQRTGVRSADHDRPARALPGSGDRGRVRIRDARPPRTLTAREYLYVALANGWASVAVSVPSVPAYESVTVTVLFAVLDGAPKTNAALSDAEPLGVKNADALHVAVAVFVPLVPLESGHE